MIGYDEATPGGDRSVITISTRYDIRVLAPYPSYMLLTTAADLTGMAERAGLFGLGRRSIAHTAAWRHYRRHKRWLRKYPVHYPKPLSELSLEYKSAAPFLAQIARKMGEEAKEKYGDPTAHRIGGDGWPE